MDSDKKLITNGLITLIILIIVGYIGARIERYLDRANPKVELASIIISGSEFPSSKVSPSFLLKRDLNDCPVKLPQFRKPDIKMSDWLISEKKLEDSPLRSEMAQETLDKISEMLKTRQPDYDKDKFRKELLYEFKKPDILDSIALRVLNQGYYKQIINNERLIRYREHPPEWKNSAMATVNISSTATMKLMETEIHESDNDTTPLCQDSCRMNKSPL